MTIEIRPVEPGVWEIPKTGGMNVPGRVYASDRQMNELASDPSLQQVVNVAHLPGIVGYALAMPDIHWGYGFPIGGVAATRADDGVISPGGVGYDINCGVRLAKTKIVFDDVRDQIPDLVRALFATVPTGVGAKGALGKLAAKEVRRVLERGARWAIDEGYGSPADVDHTEEGGCLEPADPESVSETAIERGAGQLGTLGSGNHFLELDVVDEIYLADVAARFGLERGTLAFLVHSGSRGLGYQVCDDSLAVMARAMERYRIEVPDRQLACAPFRSPEGRRYFGAMAAAANFAWANRQVMMVLAARVFERVLGLSPRDVGASLLYDVCHNVAKLETHQVGRGMEKLCVHRKGATRAFGPRHRDVPSAYRDVGQPVLIPGDMGRGSYVLVGTDRAMAKTFGSTCHGAGRVLSRAKAKKAARGRDLVAEMRELGVAALAHGRFALAEEMPEAYKDVSEVVDVMDGAGISRKVARLRPVGVIKG
jgi:tRNA-splicing ligase RtcB (3'-phosphate/5'-hydroxy nucleic acid ligase)